MDRIARLEVWSCLAHDYGLYGICARLDAMGFRPATALRSDRLDEEQTMLYEQCEDKAGRTGPYDRKIARED